MALALRQQPQSMPGYFFDFPFEAFLVVSLLLDPGRFARGVQRILERVDAA